MTKYAKLINQTLEFYVKPSNYGQISDSDLKLLAESDGFKKVNYDETPLYPEFYTISKRETTKNIYVEYTAIDLDAAKSIVKSRFDAIKEQNLNNVIVTYGEHDYKIDSRAETNLLTMLLMQVPESSWITLNDEAVTLTQADLQKLAMAAKSRIEEIYTEKMTKFAQIDACVDLESLLVIYNL